VLQVAKIKGLSAGEVASITTENALKLFPKLQQRLAAAAAAEGAELEALAEAGQRGSCKQAPACCAMMRAGDKSQGCRSR
jgi:hypothetical protein